MIRRATFTDIPAMVDLLVQAHAASKYAERVGVSRKAAHTLLQQAVTRNGGTNDGGALVLVAEHKGALVGLFVGVLDRVYHIGDKLQANDMYLFVTGRAGRIAAKFIDAYLEWTDANPKIDRQDVKLSYTDALPGAERVEKLYAAKGFHRCGGIFERAEK